MMDQIDDDVSMSSSDDEDDTSEEILKIDEYRNKIKENPEDYDLHLLLINALRLSNDIISTRTAREEMNVSFPLTPEMWIEWANDEREANSDKSFVYNLLRRGTEDYRSVDVWTELCQSSLGYFEDENDIRKTFEEAISQVGTQFNRGSLIWAIYMIYEKEVKMEGLEGIALKDQRDKVFKLYSRQLSVPLEDNEVFFNEFQEWNKDWKYPEEEIHLKFENSNKIAKTLQPFETAILNSVVDYASKKTDPEQISREEEWLKYINFVEGHMNKGDIVNLYERSLTDLCLSQNIWSSYLNYLAKNFESDKDRILSTAKRAIRNNKSSLDLRLSLARNLERFSCSANEIRDSFNSIFIAKLSDPNPFLPLWQAYLDFERRQLDLSENRDLTIIRGLFERLVAFENYLTYDPTCSLIKYWALIEARYSGSIDKCRELWALIRKSLGHNSTALWLENLEFERRFGDFDSCKKLMSNAVNCFTDYPEYLFEKVIRWTAEDGTIDSYLLFKKKIEAQQLKINERRVKEANIKKKEGDERRLKRKPEERKSSTEPAKRAKVKETKLEETQKPSTPIEKSKTPIEYCEERCVFVSNLSFKATEKELQEMFGKVGSVEDVRIVKKLTGESKGYAYIQFIDQSDVEEALKLEHVLLLERPMFVNRCDKNKRHQFTYSTGETEKNKLFVNNLPKTVTQEALVEIFGHYDGFKEARLVRMKNGVPKGTAYVDYSDENCASRALVATNGLRVGDNVLDVALSKPPLKNETVTKGGTFDSSVATFIVPSSVSKASRTQRKQIHQSTVGGVGSSTSDSSGTTKMNNADFKKFLF